MTGEEAGALVWERIRRPAPLLFQSIFAGFGLLLAWYLPSGMVAAPGLIFGFLGVASLLGVLSLSGRLLKVPRRWFFGMLLFGCFFLYGHHVYHGISRGDLRHLDERLPRTVLLKLIPIEEPAWKPGAYGNLVGNTVARVTAVNAGEGWHEARGKVWVRFEGHPGPHLYYGNEAVAGGFLKVPEPPESPGQFDFSGYLKTSGIHHVFRVRLSDWHPTGEFKGVCVMKWAIGLRAYMLGVLNIGLDPGSPWPGLMAGMLFGYRDGISSELMNEFTVTGTIHLFAVSGQNVGMILWVALVFMKSLGLIKWRWGWMVAPGLLMFCLSTGLQSSASRALIMVVLVLVAWIFHRPVTPLNLLGAAALLLWSWSPWQLFDVGFQLSFLILLALLLATMPLARALYVPLRPDVYIPRRRLPRWRSLLDRFSAQGCVMVSASMVAWVASLPLILYHFGLVSPITPVSNCIVVPLASVVLVLALLSVLVSVAFPAVVVLLNVLNAKILMLMTAVISLLASVPGSHFYISRDEAMGEDRFKLTVLSCDQSAPSILETRNRTVLIGPGSKRAWKYQVNPARQFLGVEFFDRVIILQANQRYLGGLMDLLQVVPVGQMIQQPFASSSRAYLDWVEYGQSHPAVMSRLKTVTAGEELWSDPFSRARVIWPRSGPNGWGSENAGMQILFEFDQVRIFMSGNPGRFVEQSELQNVPKAHMLIQGPHSGQANLTSPWLKKIQPEVIVRAASGFYPDRDISLEKRNELKEMSAQLIELDHTGPVQIRGGRGRYQLLFWNQSQQKFCHEP